MGIPATGLEVTACTPFAGRQSGTARSAVDVKDPLNERSRRRDRTGSSPVRPT